MFASTNVTETVCGAPPAMLNVIWSGLVPFGLAFAALIASRKVQSPTEQRPSSWSSALLTVNVGPPCDASSPVPSDLQAENSELSPVPAAVAVAVAKLPLAAVGKDALKSPCPLASTVMSVAPTNCSPSPLPEASHELLRNASSRKWLLDRPALVSSDPVRVRLPPDSVAPESTG